MNIKAYAEEHDMPASKDVRGWTPADEHWRFERMESAVEFAELKGEPLAEHDGYYRANNGNWIVTSLDADGERDGPVCEVSFRGTAKRGEAYKAPDPLGMARARLITTAPALYRALRDMVALAEPHFTDAPQTYALNAALNALAKAKG